MPENRRYLSVAAFRKLTGLSYKTIMNGIRNGEIRHPGEHAGTKGDIRAAGRTEPDACGVMQAVQYAVLK